MATQDKKYTFVTIPLKGDDDDTILNNYKAIQPALQKLDGGTVQLAGLEPVANALTGTIATDQKRMEVLALPLVAVVLFLVFGGVIAACLPVMVGGLSIAGALGILRFIAMFGPVNFFAQPVISLIGLGIAVDYGLFVVSRFREEIAEGYDTEAAVRRTVMTAGRTVTFSAVLIAASGASLLLLPQGFVKSLTYALIAAVTLAALLSITLLPACLGILGKKRRRARRAHPVPGAVPAELEGVARLPQLARGPAAEDQDPGRGRGRVLGQAGQLRHEAAADLRDPDRRWHDPARHSVGQLVIRRHEREIPTAEQCGPPVPGAFRQALPRIPHHPLTLVLQSINHQPVTDQQIADVRSKAMAISGFSDPDNIPANMWQERSYAPGASKDPRRGYAERADKPE